MKNSLIDRAAVEKLLLLAGALRSGLIDALAVGGPLTATAVAVKAGTDARATRVVLEALVAVGVVEHPPGAGARPGIGAADSVAVEAATAAIAVSTAIASVAAAQGTAMPGEAPLYRLSALGREHLVDEGPELERYGLLHQVNKMRGWLELPEVIRTGRPVPRDPARRDLRSFVSAMGERDPEVLDELVSRCLRYSGPIETMIDLGGAVGHVARHFGRCGIRATLFDREDVMPLAREFLGGDAEDIALVGGDFTQSVPAGPFDLIFLGNVCHIYGPETNTEVFRKAFAVTTPGGTIAIQDLVWGRSPRAATFAVNMLQATEDGGVWTEAEYRSWLDAAGWREIETEDLLGTGSLLILGRRPRV